MLPAINIPAPISPLCPIPLAPCSLFTARPAFSPWGLYNNCFPIPVPIPLHHPLSFLRCLALPLPILSCLRFPLPILHSLPFPGSFLTALGILLTSPIISVIAIARTAPSTARHSGIFPVLIIIILIDYIIPIQRSTGQNVAWFVLPAAWQLNFCPVIITTVPREILAGAFNIHRACCLRIRAINLIPKGMGVVPYPIVHLVMGLFKHLPHIWAEHSPPLPKRRIPAPVVRPHQLELWKVATRDWIKTDYIMKVVPCPLILDTANILYRYESTAVSRDESLYMVPIQWQASIYNQCWHLCPSLPRFFAAALWCYRCELKMNIHPEH